MRCLTFKTSTKIFDYWNKVCARNVCYGHKPNRHCEPLLGVTELHQMFLDLATLVGAQGELLDQIEYSVNEAKDYAGNRTTFSWCQTRYLVRAVCSEKGEKELVSARQGQRRAKKVHFFVLTLINNAALYAGFYFSENVLYQRLCRFSCNYCYFVCRYQPSTLKHQTFSPNASVEVLFLS